MSDKPLSVDEIMKLVYLYGQTCADSGAKFSDRVQVAGEIRAELEKLTNVAAENDLFPCCSRQGHR